LRATETAFAVCRTENQQDRPFSEQKVLENVMFFLNKKVLKVTSISSNVTVIAEGNMDIVLILTQN